MNATEYAQKVLREHGCDEYTYSNHDGEQIMRDLKEAYPNGMEFPYVAVANAIVLMSRPTLVERKPYCSVWDTDSCCDGIRFDTLEEAQEDVVSTYTVWMEECCNMSDEDWNYMINNWGAYVAKYNPETDEYEAYCYLSDEDLESIGWVER